MKLKLLVQINSKKKSTLKSNMVYQILTVNRPETKIRIITKKDIWEHPILTSQTKNSIQNNKTRHKIKFMITNKFQHPKAIRISSMKRDLMAYRIPTNCRIISNTPIIMVKMSKVIPNINKREIIIAITLNPRKITSKQKDSLYRPREIKQNSSNLIPCTILPSSLTEI